MGLAGPVVEGMSDGFEPVSRPARQIGALGEVLAQQPAGVLVGEPLPQAVGVGEAYPRAGLKREDGVD